MVDYQGLSMLATGHLAFHLPTIIVRLPLQPGAAVPRSPHTPHMARQVVSDITEEDFTGGWGAL